MDYGRISGNVTSKWLEIFRIVYVSLHSSNPDVDDPIFSEITGAGYRRLKMSMDIVSDRSVVNTTSIKFTNLPNTLVTHIGLWSTEINGDLLASAPMENPLRVTSGASLQFIPSTIAVSLS